MELTEIRKIIKETVRSTFESMQLDEAELTNHFSVDRFRKRFLTRLPKTVGYEIGPNIYEDVGTKILDPNDIAEIEKKISIIENTRFPLQKSYAVLLYDFYILPETVKFFSEEAKIESKGETLFYIDRETKSNGNLAYAIIRANKLVTIFFAKSTVQIDTKKFRVDHMIKNFQNVIDRKISS